MNLKLVVFIIVDVIIILLLFIQLRYTMSTPQGFSRLQQMRSSFLQRLNLAMSDIKADQDQESKKKLLRFKVKEAKTLNDRIAKYIAKAPSSKDNIGQKVSSFQILVGYCIATTTANQDKARVAAEIVHQ